LKNLDKTILSIASADENSVGENLERPKTFLRDPTYFYGQPGPGSMTKTRFQKLFLHKTEYT
jgi:hypothetical protein